MMNVPEIFPARCKEYPHQECLFMDGHWWWVCPGCGVAWFSERIGWKDQTAIVLHGAINQLRNHG